MPEKKRILGILLLLDLLSDEDEEPTKKRDRVEWIRPWLARREQRGIYHLLIRELSLQDTTSYREFFRINKEQFQFLVREIANRIAKKDTVMRSSIKPDERLAVTLRFLATGETFKSLEYSFRISRTTISSIELECCEAIYDILGPTYLKTPDSEEEWSRIAQLFKRRWNFLHGIGAIDGERIIIQQPCNSGSHYFDYKEHHSIILLAVFGPNYECLWADMGTNGRAPDRAIWRKSDLRELLSSEDNRLHLPDTKPLPMRSKQIHLFHTVSPGVPILKIVTFQTNKRNILASDTEKHTKSKWLKDALGELVIVILVIQFNWRQKAVLLQNFIVFHR